MRCHGHHVAILPETWRHLPKNKEHLYLGQISMPTPRWFEPLAPPIAKETEVEEEEAEAAGAVDSARRGL